MNNTKTFITLCAALGAAALLTAASFFGPATPVPQVDSTLGGTSTSLATNGTYSSSIGVASSGPITIETNLVKLTGNVAGNELLISIVQGSSAAWGSNMVYTLTTVPKGKFVNITNNAIGAASASAIRSTTPWLFTNWFNQASATAGATTACTNILLSPFSTPAYSADMDVYLESIAFNGTNGCYSTNFNVTAVGLQ